MAIYKLPNGSSLVDGQFIQVTGPNGIKSGFLYDQQTKTFYGKESQVIIPSQHGTTHIAEDEIPSATQVLPGLMSADDKAKLDVLTQTRLGVLGFQGAGFPDDGGWLQGDVILAAGSEFISLERFGNVIRFTVDSPIPLNCPCEECAQIFWIQDVTDTASITPPTCAGKLPGVNSYGELKVYLMPESTVVDPANPTPTLNLKVKRPSFIFKRYDDSIVPGSAEIDVVLKRRTSGIAEIGWAMTPGATGVPECVWTMGDDSDGNEIRFELDVNSAPGLLGHLLYKGHTLTRQMAVVTGYDASVLSTNIYKVRNWSVLNSEPVGEAFDARNIWRYENPENSSSSVTAPKALILDATVDLLEVGTLVQTWGFQIGEINGERLYRWYFNSRPRFNEKNAYSLGDIVRFGDLLTARDEVTGPGITELTAHTLEVADTRVFERSQWGLTGFDDRLILSDDGLDIDSSTTAQEAVFTDEPSGDILNGEFVADIDYSLPGLRVFRTDPDTYVERPVNLWHRQNHKNIYAKMLIGRPDASIFPPYDILLGAPIDSLDDVYLKVIRRGRFEFGPFAGQYYVVVKGATWKEIPQSGSLRILTNAFKNKIWDYTYKAAFSGWDDDGVVLIGFDEIFPFDDDLDSTDVVDIPSLTTIAQILHVDYNAPAVRLEFSVNQTPGEEVVQLQFKVGTLDMSTVYELEDEVTPQTVEDNLVRGLEPGYAVSQIFTQVGFVSTPNEAVESDPSDFVVYEGGLIVDSSGETVELWNTLELLYRDDQLWIWWNGKLVPPSTTESASLDTPVAINTPYFPLTSKIGKFGMRLWPGSTLREAMVRDQLFGFSEYKYGQLEISDSDSGSGSGS